MPFDRRAFGRQTFDRHTLGRHLFDPYIWSTVYRCTSLILHVVEQMSVGKKDSDQKVWHPHKQIKHDELEATFTRA